MHRLPGLAGVLAVLLVLPPTPVLGERIMIVTPQEAALAPPAEIPAQTRAVTRGPAVRLVSPTSSPATVSGPFWLRVEFTGRGGARPDPATLRVRYLRAFPVDISARVRPFATPDALEIREADLPSGTHHLMVEIQDNQGRGGTALLEFRKP